MKVGRLDEAVEAAEEAIQIYRDLLAEEAPVPDPEPELPPRKSFRLFRRSRPQPPPMTPATVPSAKKPSWRIQETLANSLRSRADALSALGKHEQSAADREEAIALYRVLPAKYDILDIIRVANLAGSLREASITLGRAGRDQTALEYAREAVDLERDLLSRVKPSEDQFAYRMWFRPGQRERFNLAISLVICSGCLAKLGHRSEALESAEETVAILRELTEQDLSLNGRAFPWALYTLSLRLKEMKQLAEATRVAEEAIEVLRSLVEKDSSAYCAYLAKALEHLSDLLRQSGRGQESQAAAREAAQVAGGTEYGRIDDPYVWFGQEPPSR